MWNCQLFTFVRYGLLNNRLLTPSFPETLFEYLETKKYVFTKGQFFSLTLCWYSSISLIHFFWIITYSPGFRFHHAMQSAFLCVQHVLGLTFYPRHQRKCSSTQLDVLINIEPAVFITLRQGLDEPMETRNHNPRTTSSFLHLLSHGQPGGLISLDWGLLSLLATPPAFLQSLCSWARAPNRAVRMLSGRDSGLRWRAHCAWHDLRTVALNASLRYCAFLGTRQGYSSSPSDVQIDPVPFDIATVMIEHLMGDKGAKEAIAEVTWDLWSPEVWFLLFGQVSDGRLQVGWPRVKRASCI